MPPRSSFHVFTALHGGFASLGAARQEASRS
jgi:hypothetical protein